MELAADKRPLAADPAAAVPRNVLPDGFGRE
jgi:hypothetical protein